MQWQVEEVWTLLHFSRRRSTNTSPCDKQITKRVRELFSELVFCSQRNCQFKGNASCHIRTFLGSAAGAEVVQYIDANLLTSLIPILLVVISLYFLLMPKRDNTKVNKVVRNAVAFLGGGVGFYDGFFGPGTGSIFTVCFVVVANLLSLSNGQSES